MNKTEVSLVRCDSYEIARVEAAVKESIDLLGGIERFIKAGEKVLLKPNLLTDAAPDKAITTHPEVLRAVARLVKTVTPYVYCGDSPSVWGGEKKNIDHVYEVCGISDVCRQEGVELVYFTKPRLAGGHPLADWAFSCDKLINIPKLKTHGLTVLTASVKNLFGLVVGMHKMKIHRDNPKPVDLSKAIVDIYEARKPDLNIVDAIVSMEGQGPGSAGTLKKMGLVAASGDGACLDVVLAYLMNLNILEVPTNRETIARKLAPPSVASIDTCGCNIKDFIKTDYKLPKTSALARMPKWGADILASFLSMKPSAVASKCRLCGACMKACPVGAIKQDKGGMVFDKGKCILCLCCQEVCPYAAIDIKRGLLLRLLSR